jgi:hypothetical protein
MACSPFEIPGIRRTRANWSWVRLTELAHPDVRNFLAFVIPLSDRDLDDPEAVCKPQARTAPSLHCRVVSARTLGRLSLT